jgi:superfamily II DNA/RNA helicase
MSDKNFEYYGFSKEILKALQNLGYEKLTDVQEQVIPFVLKEKDIIVRAQTGSGKTAAFAIPICEKLTLEQRNPQVLVLTPTRELAVQLKQDIANIGRFKRIRCATILGGQSMELQIRELRQRVHVIVGTPGRTFDHIERSNINLEAIKYLIIDEADKMLALGFIEQIEAIIHKLPANRITMLFSATIPDKIEEICQQYMINPVKIEVATETLSVATIRQSYYEVEENEKFDLLKKIIYIEKSDRAILFCNTRDKVETLFGKLSKEGYFCGSLHGGQEQRDRLLAIQRFKHGEFHFLIATDVAARGLHVEELSLVINYDLPLDNESYVHRIGRTGRAGHTGTAITFVVPKELTILQEIEAYIHYQIPQQKSPTTQAVEQGQLLFESRLKMKPKSSNDYNDGLNKEITRLRINAGKKTKMRPGDILGAISHIDGIIATDIGIIDVQNTCSYVEILGGKGDLVLDTLQTTKIKGKIHTFKKVDFDNS